MIITDRTRIENIINRTPIWERTNDIDADQQIGTTPLDLVTGVSLYSHWDGLAVDDELICEYRVYSYRTLVAFVTFHPYSVRIPTIRVCKDAFDHSRTTSKHLHRFITALLAPFDLKPDWDDAHKWCSNSLWSVTSVPVTSI